MTPGGETGRVPRDYSDNIIFIIACIRCRGVSKSSKIINIDYLTIKRIMRDYNILDPRACKNISSYDISSALNSTSTLIRASRLLGIDFASL